MAKELGLKIDHPDVQRVFLAVYKSFMEVHTSVEVSRVYSFCSLVCVICFLFNYVIV